MINRFTGFEADLRRALLPFSQHVDGEIFEQKLSEVNDIIAQAVDVEREARAADATHAMGKARDVAARLRTMAGELVDGIGRSAR